MLDLIMLEKDGKRTMFAAYLDEDGREWRSSLFPSTGAIGPISKEIMREFPGEYETQEDVQLMLSVIHFRNMANRKNAAGQDYPIKLSAVSDTAP